jgi:hypothetical protein
MFAQVCQQLRREAEIKKIDGWQELQKEYWTEIDKKLQREKQAYERVLKGEKAHDQRPIHPAISHTCTRVGFNVDDMLQISISMQSGMSSYMRTLFLSLRTMI